MDLRATGPHLPMSGSSPSYSGPRVKIDPADLEKVLIIYEKANVSVYSNTKINDFPLKQNSILELKLFELNFLFYLQFWL